MANLRAAKKNKNDEFYTHYEDIKNEVDKYKEQFKDKVVYLPCDHQDSNFWLYFKDNFEAFGLKKLIATHYHLDNKVYKIWIDELGLHKEDLIGNGDFRSPECVEILKECDIVCTNPPFSLFREFVDLIMTHKKHFLIIGNKNAFTYKEIFPLIKNDKIWIGYTQPKDFRIEDGSITKGVNGLCRWFTNLKVIKRNEEIILTKTYNPIDYPKYDEYDAIEVNKVVNIPRDYDGLIGVPITFIDKYNPNQFEIIGLDDPTLVYPAWRGRGPNLNGKTLYRRIFIKRKTNGD